MYVISHVRGYDCALHRNLLPSLSYVSCPFKVGLSKTNIQTTNKVGSKLIISILQQLYWLLVSREYPAKTVNFSLALNYQHNEGLSWQSSIGENDQHFSYCCSINKETCAR